MLTRVHTILFTEACPLECRYCFLKDDESFGTTKPLNFEEILEAVDYYDKTDDPKTVTSRLLFTGGEPFLYWEEIKYIIDKYQHRFQYEFNTSGYLFTESILKYLSDYTVSFVLSVDGDEKLTNYLRPVKNSPYHTGYFKKLKSIVPTLLFYFPTTPYRIIVNPRYVDLLYKYYLTAEQLGFRYFTFILDFESRPSNTIKGIQWSEKYTKILEEQLNLIIEEIILGFQQGIKKPEIININKIITFLFNEKEFTPDNLICKVFDGRTVYTMTHKDLDAYCMQTLFNSKEEAWNKIMQQYKESDGKCKNDNKCEAFNYCITNHCPKDSWDLYGEFFRVEDLDCITTKLCYQSAIKLLSISNEVCPDSSTYKRFLNQFYMC